MAIPKDDQWFKFYFKRIIMSTQGWKDDEFGAYVRLLIHQFDKRGLPDDPEELSGMITSYKKNWPKLSKKFLKEDDGMLRNQFMKEVREERDSKSNIGKQSGEQGGRPKKVAIDQIRFYLIECFDAHECFYKAGTTKESIQRRYSSTAGGNSAIPYKFKIIIDEIIDFKGGLDIENEIMQSCERYQPRKIFGGHNECYTKTTANLKSINLFLFNKKPKGFSSLSSSFSSSESVGEEGSLREEEEVGLSPGSFMTDTLSKAMVLTDEEISNSIEYLRITTKKVLTNADVVEQWEGFKIKNFSEKKWYSSHQNLINHFRDSLKTQINNGTYRKDDGEVKPKPAGGKSSGAHELVGKLRGSLAATGPGQADA